MYTRGLFLILAASFQLSAPLHAAEIWMLGAPHVEHHAPGWESVRTDTGSMWTPDAPWKTVAGAVRVIQFPPTSVDRARDSDLREALADLKRRNIALAVGTGMLIRSDRCRAKTEAYVDQKTMENLFEKRKMCRPQAGTKLVVDIARSFLM